MIGRPVHWGLFELLERHATEALQQFFRECGRDAPGAFRCEVHYEPALGDITFELHPEGRRLYLWRLTWQELRGHRYDPYACDAFIRERLPSIYSRLYEDNLIECDVAELRRGFHELLAAAPDPSTAAQLGEQFELEADRIRRRHYVRRAPPQRLNGYRYIQGLEGVWSNDVPERLGIGRTLQEQQDRLLTAAMLGTAVEEPAPRPEPSTFTAEMVRNIATMIREMPVNVREVGRLLLGDGFAEAFGIGGQVGTEDAHAKGLKLLDEWLSPAQRECLKTHNYFEVTGGTTGTRYRIRRGRQQNIDELDADGKKVALLCFLPEGQLVAGDCMLAQKIALESNETEALRVANRWPSNGRGSGGGQWVLPDDWNYVQVEGGYYVGGGGGGGGAGGSASSNGTSGGNSGGNCRLVSMLPPI